MPKMTGGMALADALVANGVDTVFSLPGLQLDHLFNAFHDRKDDLRVIQTRHEQGAGYMAFGYAQATGRTGVYAVVPGPGVLNTTAALATAYGTKTPVLALTGQLPLRAIGQNRGELHEIPDQLGLLRTLTRRADRICHPAQAHRAVNAAFQAIHDGRKLPCALEMPMDVMGTEVEVAPLPKADLPPLTAPDPALVTEAAQMLAGAERPVIVFGSGAEGMGDAIRALAERLQAPVFSSRGAARGLIDERHPLSVNLVAAQEVWKTADVVLALGTRLQPQQCDWGTTGIRIIHAEVDPEELGRYGAPDIGILGDAAQVLDGLLAQVPDQSRASRNGEMQAIKSRARTRALAEIAPQMGYVDALRAALPEDGILVDELTQVGYACRLGFEVYGARTTIISGYQGTLGYGYATALGAQIGAPGRPVLSLNGDGGFMYTMNELATAVQYSIPVVAVVFVDGAFGNVKRDQLHAYGNRVIGSEFHNPDFVALARAFGAEGFAAEGPQDLAGKITQAFATGRPSVVTVPIGQVPSPFGLWAPSGLRG